MNNSNSEWVLCAKCIHFEDCTDKENRDGCYFGETERIGRWKGAGMGEYYCSLCFETVSGNRERECPNCHALMYTDEEWADKLEEWKLEDELYVV